MPGIVGIITNAPPKQAKAELLRMVESMRHESFYVTGTWIDESMGLYVGWIERSASCANGMPICNESGSKVLLFSGEEFPDPDTSQHLKQLGHALNQDNNSYLVHLAEEDPQFPLSLNGQFHGVLADRQSGKVTLFNDRFGLHRIYYHEAKDAFYFSAEAKAILAVRPELRSLDSRGLSELVTCGCVLEDRTLFGKVHVLPVASVWTFRSGNLDRKHHYFSAKEWEDQSVLDPESYYSQVRAVFQRNLPRYFNAREPIGLSLTGGLDTRIILAWQKPSPGSVPCYTFAGSLRECRDVSIARKVATACGQSHEIISVGADFLSQFSRYAERTVYITDGCTSVYHAPDLYLNEIARQISRVRMTGNYGDQVLRHLTVFRPVAITPGLFSPDLLTQAARAETTFTQSMQGHALTVAAMRQTSWHYQGLLALESSQLAVRTPYLDNDLVRTLYRAPASTLANNDLRVRLIGDGNATLRRIRTDLGFAGNGGPIAEAFSSRYQRFTMRAEFAYDYGMPQWLARIDHRFASLHLERAFIGRHKFSHFRLWYRDALANYVREMLLDSRTLSRPYLNRRAVEAIVKGHLIGNRNYTVAIHQILTLEYLHRLFLDAK